MISLLFSHGGDLGSRAIEWFGGGPKYSHVDAIMPDGKLLGSRSDEVGGAISGVWIRNADYLGDKPTLRVDLPCTLQQETLFYDFLEKQIGKRYDKLAIFSFATGRNWQDDDAWFCDELQAAALVSCGYFKFPLASPANRITPGDLLLVLSAFVEIRNPRP